MSNTDLHPLRINVFAKTFEYQAFLHPSIAYSAASKLIWDISAPPTSILDPSDLRNLCSLSRVVFPPSNFLGVGNIELYFQSAPVTLNDVFIYSDDDPTLVLGYDLSENRINT